MARANAWPAERAAMALADVQPAIDAIERIYEFWHPGQVRAFLVDHPELLPLLAEGAEIIPRFVPPHGPIRLLVSWDPEDGDDPGELFAMVPSRLEPEEIAPRMAELRSTGAVRAFRRSDGFFNVGVEYR